MKYAEITSKTIPATLLATLISFFAWKILGQRPQLDLIFLISAACSLACLLIGAAVFGFELLAISVSGVSLGTISESLKYIETTPSQLMADLADLLSPAGIAISVLTKIFLAAVLIFVVKDYFMFQRVMHAATAKLMRKWAIVVAAFLALALTVFFAPSVFAQEIKYECDGTISKPNGNNFCVSHLHRSQDAKRPGNVQIRIFGRLNHSLTSLQIQPKGIEIRSDNPSAGGLLMVQKVELEFAPYVSPKGLGPVTDVKYRWTGKKEGTATLPLNVGVTEKPLLQVPITGTIKMKLPDNYDEGQKRLRIFVWIEFRLPNGGISSAGAHLYCVYQGGACVTN